MWRFDSRVADYRRKRERINLRSWIATKIVGEKRTRTLGSSNKRRRYSLKDYRDLIEVWESIT